MLRQSASELDGGSYVFVSYSHRDARRVLREIRRLEEAGIAVWYDDAIRPGHRWRVELARAIDGCSAFLLFTSRSAVQSSGCAQELAYAAEQNRPILQVQLEDTELPTEFRFALAVHQAIHAWELPREEYWRRLAAALRARLDGTDAPVPETGNARQSALRRWWVGVGLAAVIVTGAVAATILLPARPAPDGPAEPTFQAPARSIAVMRFITIGENTALGDGLCEHLLHLLMGLREISVPSRTSSWHASDQQLDPRQVAQRLGVRYVLEGSVQQVDSRLRVTAQLVNGITGHQVWSERYDEQLTARTYFEIQADIAAQLLDQLKVTLSAGSQALIGARPTDDDAALRAYLEGRALRRGPNTMSSIAQAQEHFQYALTLDPDFAEAHAALCESHLAAYGVERDDQSFAAARQHCLEAQRIDRSQIMVLVALGTLYRYEGRLADAEIEIERALEIQPDNTAVLEEQGRLLRTMGRLEEAKAVFEKAIRAEPGNWSVYKSLGNFLVRTGRYAEAVGAYRQSLRMDPGNEVVENNLATALHIAGDFAAAGELWDRISAEKPSLHAFLNLANARFYEGRFESAVDWYSRAIELADSDFRGYGGRAASLEYAHGADAARADYLRAAELAELATERNPDDTTALSRLNFYRAKLGETALARSGLERLLTNPALDPNARFMVALTHITLDDLESARRALDEAVAAGFSMALVRADPLVARGLPELVDRDPRSAVRRAPGASNQRED